MSKLKSKLDEMATDFLFPPKLWPGTFRTATALAVLAAVACALVRAFVRFPAERVAEWESMNLLQSPLFLGLFYLFVAVVLWFIYATRQRAGWYACRVSVYCLMLAGALIGLVDFMLPLRTR